MEKEDFNNRIYSLPFKGFKNVDLEKVFMVIIENYDESCSEKTRWIQYKNSRLYNRYKYSFLGNTENKYIAFYSDFFYRADHKEIFVNFIREFQYFDYIIPERLEKDKLSIKRFVFMLRYDVIDYVLLKKLKMNRKKRLFILKNLGLIRRYAYIMNGFLQKKMYCFGLVYSDSCPYDNMIVQMMREKGIHTATLQHGIFSMHNYFRGVEYRASVSDDFLAWGRYVKELAIESGMAESKIKSLGIPRYITEKGIEKNVNQQVFSVVLGMKVLAEENIRLICFANQVARIKEMKYYLRYHPSCRGDEYIIYVDRKYILCEENKRESLKEMCMRTDFSLISSGTSVIFDLIFLKHPFYEFHEVKDGIKSMKRCNFFSDIDELCELLENNEICDEEFEYYCTTREIKQAYNDYFMDVLR